MAGAESDTGDAQTHQPEWDEDDIQSFWGQLWYIPKSILP
jgi:hypothetical protein